MRVTPSTLPPGIVRRFLEMVVSTFSMHPVLVDCSDLVTYQSRSPYLQVKGRFIQNILSCLDEHHREVFEALDEAGIHALETEKWYSEQSFLNLIKDLSESIGPTALMKMGKHIPDTLDFPQEVFTIDEAFNLLNQLLRRQYRGAKSMYYKIKRINRHAVEVICCHAYPCEMDMGILSSIADRFTKDGVIPKVIHRSACKKNGSSHCAIMIYY